MRFIFILFFWANVAVAQVPPAPSDLKMMGTRDWIKLEWKDNAANEEGFRIFYSTKNRKPATPAAVVDTDKTHYYLQHLKAQTKYYVWVEAYNTSGSSKPLYGNTVTVKNWILQPEEAAELDIPSSAAVPAGMQLFWHDEFNDEILNKNKWATNYYSTIDYLRKENWQALKGDSLPEAAYTLNGHSINLFVNDSLPVKPFSNGKKISSIQTYNWSTNENLLDNSRGGYFEARVKRTFTGKPQGLNTAFWFDSPGPGLKYYLERGTTYDGTQGIRPSGQAFEIDIFEYINAQFVIHGHVDKNGKFVHNLATDIAKGYEHKDQWVTHGILWTPSSISHYINGKLIKSYDNKHQIYSPNHFMNVLLGSYGKGGSVSMEVDYIRGYQWPLANGNELPNPGFEYSDSMLPWEGSGQLSNTAGRNGSKGVVLKPGQMIEQYVYLNNQINYEMGYWSSGKALLNIRVDNVTLVSGALNKVIDTTTQNKMFASMSATVGRRPHGNKDSFTHTVMNFKTGKEYGDQMKTIRVAFTNKGESDIVIDEITISKK